MHLRDYQQEALDAIVEASQRGVRKQLAVLGTGAGKTVIASHIPQLFPGKTLFLAHRGELLEQARHTFSSINPTLRTSIEKADEYASEQDDIVFASVQTLGRTGSTRLERFDRNHFNTIIIDESHHLTKDNSTYWNIVEYFKVDLRLGITATPQRGDHKSLVDVFDEIVYFKPMEALIKEGWLVPLKGYRIDTPIDISSVKTRAGDYVNSELAQAVNVDERNKIIVDAYKEFVPNKKAVVFCVNVEHAKELSRTFQQMGVASTFVVGEMDKEDRAAALGAFSQGDVKVICNVAVLTEGWDDTSVEAILFARPTKSQVFYVQATGRGSRLHEGKQDCTIIDFADATKGKRPISLPTLMGIPDDFDLEGQDPMEIKEKYDELAEEAPQEAIHVQSVEDIENAWKRIDLFMPPEPNPELLEYSNYIWMDGGQETFLLNLTGGEKLKIKGDALGRYTVTFKHTKGVHKLGECDTIQEAFARTDRWIVRNRLSKTKLIDNDAEWRKKPPSEKQLKWLKKFNVPITSTMTSGDASIILDQMFQKNPKKETNRPKWLQDKIDREKLMKGRS